MSRSDVFIAYAVQRHPSLRTTFIRREIDAIRQLGVRVEVVSMRPADQAELRGEAEAQAHLESTHYLAANPLSWNSIRANVTGALRSPRATLANLLLAMSHAGKRGLKPRVRLALQSWRGAVMADQLGKLGRPLHVHAHFADGAATTALAAARLLGVPFSFTSHTSFDSSALAVKLREAAFVASISRFDREKLITLGGTHIAEKIHVVHCGLPPEQWSYQPKHGFPHPLQLLSVGALIEKKGHDVLIRACRLLIDRGRDVRCRIVGAGPQRDELSKLINCLDLNGIVELTGPLPQAKVRRELTACDVFVLACRQASNGDSDGIPVSLMEAMALGRAVISCRIAGIPDLITHGLTGHLAEPGSAESLATTVEHVCVLSDCKRRDVLTAARSHVERRFNAQSEAAKLRDLLHSSPALAPQRDHQIASHALRPASFGVEA